MLAPLLGAQEDARPQNHLADQTSPYLLQHVRNPVDWWPWGPAALERAVAEDKPIFLSIGYSACHWCHVMEKESFENEEVAAFLNQHFVSIKVDREERPDLDELYMEAVQRMTGSGGWPMTVFLTPERKPFYGGTYFPPVAQHGRPGFLDLLHGVQDAWTNRRAELLAAAEEMSGMLAVDFPPAPASKDLPSAKELRRLYEDWSEDLRAAYDPVYGGFGAAPKFPHAEYLRFLLAAAAEIGGLAGNGARDMSLHSLRKMAAGGMYDQIGGGFARYSVDKMWLIPHFEKMLYDQGTLIPAYVDAWRVSGDVFFAQIARECCDYLLREMQGPAGGFYASTDADSEGHEGRFFAWTPAQLSDVLGPERGAFAAWRYGVTEKGTFEEGSSVLQAALSAEGALKKAGLKASDPAAYAEQVRADLYAARAKRVPPGLDDKIVLGWNGLAVDALAMAGRVLDEPRYTAAAERCARFLLEELRAEDGSWSRTWRGGVAKHRAVLEDHAYLLRGFISLFQSTGEEMWLREAETLGQLILHHFGDAETGLLWDTDGADVSVLHRRKSPHDGAIPSPNAVALECFTLLHAFTQEAAWFEAAQAGTAASLPLIMRSPTGFLTGARALAGAVNEPAVAVVIGTGASDSLSAWRLQLAGKSHFAVLPVFRAAAAPDSPLGLFTSRTARDGKATLYLCRGRTCEAPRTAP
jgi:uncharacterized protein YyaL (SSP411 family)